MQSALRERRVFATNGIRPWLDVSIDGRPMGSVLAAESVDRSEHVLRIRYEATSPIDRVELVRSGHTATLAPDPGSPLRFELERRIPPLGPRDFHYVRFIEADGGLAWSSPIFGAPASD